MNDKTKIVGLISIIVFIIILIFSFSIITYFNIKEENKKPIKKLTTTTIQSTTKPTTTTTHTTTTQSTTTHQESTTTNKIIIPSSTTTQAPEEDVILITEDSLEDWPYKIFKIINEERIKKGLESLSVKKDIYDLSLSAVNKWEEIKDSGLKEYLKEYNYYGYQSNILSNATGYKIIANETIKNTDITTNKYLKYIGLSLIQKDKRYYFIIIYE